MKNLFLLSAFFAIACQSPTQKPTTNTEILEKKSIEQEMDTTYTKTTNKYSWLSNYVIDAALINTVALPKGYKRIAVKENSFSDWLRFLPLKPSEAKVMLHNGEMKGRQDVHERVIDIDVGRRDLQQCADAVMRLKAEYHYSREEWQAIHFKYTSGDKVSFEDWRKGRKPRISGNKVVFSPITNQTNNSYDNFKKYLTQVFSYAGTASLSQELESVTIDEMQIGDVFIKGGFPGHAVIVMDMAQNEKGKRIFLLAQSYMPAQSIHILKNFAHDDKLGAWYSLDFGEVLNTPEWRFSRDQLKRFK